MTRSRTLAIAAAVFAVLSAIAAAFAHDAFVSFYDYTRNHPLMPADELTATVQATARAATPTGLAWVFLAAALVSVIAALAVRDDRRGA